MRKNWLSRTSTLAGCTIAGSQGARPMRPDWIWARISRSDKSMAAIYRTWTQLSGCLSCRRGGSRCSPAGSAGRVAQADLETQFDRFGHRGQHEIGSEFPGPLGVHEHRGDPGEGVQQRIGIAEAGQPDPVRDDDAGVPECAQRA